jgi:hypothetical protein
MITRLTHLLWSRAAGAALLPLAVVLALLPSAAPAHAQAQRIPLAGTDTETFDFSTISRTWAAGPFTLDRDNSISGTFNFGALAGTVTAVFNDRFDGSTGDGHVWGTWTYTATSGLVCSGQGNGKTRGFFLTAQIVAPCSDGSLLRGTEQTVSFNFDEVVSTVQTFQGELLIP